MAKHTLSLCRRWMNLSEMFNAISFSLHILNKWSVFPVMPSFVHTFFLMSKVSSHYKLKSLSSIAYFVSEGCCLWEINSVCSKVVCWLCCLVGRNKTIILLQGDYHMAGPFFFYIVMQSDIFSFWNFAGKIYGWFGLLYWWDCKCATSSAQRRGKTYTVSLAWA